MPVAFPPPVLPSAELVAAVEGALARIPPLWPLTHFVAVNPFVGLSGWQFSDACALLERSAGAAPLLAPADYLSLHRDGAFNDADLAAIRPATSPARLLHSLHTAPATPASTVLDTVADRLDRRLSHAHWAVFVTEEISKFCAAYFDENQTTWRSPWHGAGLFTAWREFARHDLNPEAFGLRNFRSSIAELPVDALESIAVSRSLLDGAPGDPADFLYRHLLTISGWASYCQYLTREDTLRGRANSSLRDLLAIRLAYDVALQRAFAGKLSLLAVPPAPAGLNENTLLLSARLACQTAYELGYQRTLARQLASLAAPVAGPRASAQAVFCIDVRSEVFRRHLEAAAPAIVTVGFAGFFGFPVAHRPLLADATAARCPVLLVPPCESADVVDPATAANEREAFAGRGAWQAFQNSAASCFAFVETAGLAFGGALSRRPRAAAPSCHRPVPALTGADSPAKLDSLAALCEGALRNMSLNSGFGRLLLICGHGSTSANNPYASALDCGACGGHAGDVNARLAANALNLPEVRSRLAARGLVLPSDTWAVAGLHHTTSDDVTLFELERVPASHAADVEALRLALARAGDSARRERAPSLGLAATPPSELTAAIRARADDIAQVRPEWGLANNAAILVAPRARSRGLHLAGRTFLHDYDHVADADSKVLDLILAAPVVVASWINLQYYASRVDPARYGSGNKALHNVAGGLGVFEGNGGDLRPGLPLQSLHDGEKFRHEPRRLSVFVEAPRTKISLVLSRQPAPRELADHEWIHLFALEADRCFRYSPGGGWVPFI